MQGLDIETTALDPAEGSIRLVQVTDYPDVHVYGAGHEDVPSVLRNLANPVAHNATFEREWIRQKFGVDLGVIHDTMVMSHVLYGGTDASRSPRFSHSLAAVAKRELGAELDKAEQTADWSGPITESMIRYAAADAQILPDLAARLTEQLEDAGLMRVYELERRVSHAVDTMERNGFALHEGRLHNFIEGTKREAAELRKELEDAWGINPGSSKQLREYFGLEDREDWPTTKGGAPKTDQDAMRALEEEEPTIAKWLAWKKVEKMRSTYGESLAKKLVNGRIHARFKQFGTATGRFSSADPNLQNIPKDWAVRGMFWSGSEDRVLIKADYSGIELWLAAVLWREHRMMKLLADGTNLHTATAAAIYGKPMSAIGKDSVERHVGKTANFALLYGAGQNRLRTQLASDGVRIGEQEAYDIFKKFLNTYPAFSRRRYEIRTGFEDGRIKEARTRLVAGQPTIRLFGLGRTRLRDLYERLFWRDTHPSYLQRYQRDPVQCGKSKVGLEQVDRVQFASIRLASSRLVPLRLAAGEMRPYFLV